jgi:nitroreductase
MNRTFNYNILEDIKNRWSSRALSDEKIKRDDILALIEAARYAPSCFNDQPWHFIIADTDDALAMFRPLLTPGNQAWAGKAPVLILICARKNFAGKTVENFHHRFDTGTAWGYFTLEAEHRGLIAHGMAGFDRAAAEKAVQLPPEFEALTMVAVGKPGNADELPPEIKEREHPGTRNELSKVYSLKTFGTA